MRHLAAGLLALLASASPAAAQAPPGGQFTGGGMSPSASRLAGGSEVAVTVSADGRRVRVRASAYASCGGRSSAEGNGVGVFAVAPDGSFAGRLRGGRQLWFGGPRRMRVAGTVGPGGAQGTFDLALRLRSRKRTCRGSVPWRALPAPSVGPTPAPPVAGAVLLGRTNGIGGGPFGFNLRVSPDGGRITHTLFTLRRRCRRLAQPEETNIGPRVAIRADGSFRSVERFTTRYTDAIERTKSVITGRFVAGGAVGTARITAIARSPRTRRVIDRCDSRVLRWSAAVAP